MTLLNSSRKPRATSEQSVNARDHWGTWSTSLVLLSSGSAHSRTPRKTTGHYFPGTDRQGMWCTTPHPILSSARRGMWCKTLDPRRRTCRQGSSSTPRRSSLREMWSTFQRRTASTTLRRCRSGPWDMTHRNSRLAMFLRGRRSTTMHLPQTPFLLRRLCTLSTTSAPWQKSSGPQRMPSTMLLLGLPGSDLQDTQSKSLNHCSEHSALRRMLHSYPSQLRNIARRSSSCMKMRS